MDKEFHAVVLVNAIVITNYNGIIAGSQFNAFTVVGIVANILLVTMIEERIFITWLKLPDLLFSIIGGTIVAHYYLDGLIGLRPDHLEAFQ
jgi:hypothetical protein